MCYEVIKKWVFDDFLSIEEEINWGVFRTILIASVEYTVNGLFITTCHYYEWLTAHFPEWLDTSCYDQLFAACPEIMDFVKDRKDIFYEKFYKENKL